MTDEKQTYEVAPVNSFKSFKELQIDIAEAAPPPTVFTSLNLSTEEGKDWLIDAMITGGEDPAAYINTVLEVVNITAFPITFVSKESGQVVKTLSTLLHLKDGRMVQFKSDGVWKNLQIYLGVGRIPPYNPPLCFKLIRRTYANGHSGYQLDRVASTPISKPKK